MQNCVLVCAIVVGLDGECACCGGCVSEHGRWQSDGVVLVSVWLGRDRPFEVSLADVVKAMESVKLSSGRTSIMVVVEGVVTSAASCMRRKTSGSNVMPSGRP